MQHPAFISGDFDTHFVKNHFYPSKMDETNELEAEVAAILANSLIKKERASVVNHSIVRQSKWRKNRLA